MRNLLVVMLFACGGSSTPPPAAPVANRMPPAPDPPPDSTAAIMAKMSMLGDEMCACADAACATKVSDVVTKWGQDMAKEHRQPPKMTEAESKALTEVAERLGQCMQKAMAGASGAP